MWAFLEQIEETAPVDPTDEVDPRTEEIVGTITNELCMRLVTLMYQLRAEQAKLKTAEPVDEAAVMKVGMKLKFTKTVFAFEMDTNHPEIDAFAIGVRKGWAIVIPKVGHFAMVIRVPGGICDVITVAM